MGLHNTLVALEGSKDCADVRDVRLTDYGAAFAADGEAFQRLDVRSFGWLLQDLLELLVEPEGSYSAVEMEIRERLANLRARCACDTVDELPSFQELVAQDLALDSSLNCVLQ